MTLLPGEFSWRQLQCSEHAQWAKQLLISRKREGRKARGRKRPRVRVNVPRVPFLFIISSISLSLYFEQMLLVWLPLCCHPVSICCPMPCLSSEEVLRDTHARSSLPWGTKGKVSGLLVQPRLHPKSHSLVICSRVAVGPEVQAALQSTTLLSLLPYPNLIRDSNFISSGSSVTVTGYGGGRLPKQSGPRVSERQSPYPLEKSSSHALH